MTIKDLKPGDFFTLRPVDIPKPSQVYIRREYDRSRRRYRADRFDDIGADRLLKPTTVVYTEMEF